VSKPYESFGWSGIVPPYQYTASAKCEEDTKFLVVSSETFMKLLKQNPEFGFKVMQHINEIIGDRLRNNRQAL
jgi:CRP-like cAMP-binding protein